MNFKIELGTKAIQTVSAGIFKGMGKFQQEIGTSLDKLSAYDYKDTKMLSHLFYNLCYELSLFFSDIAKAIEYDKGITEEIILALSQEAIKKALERFKRDYESFRKYKT